MGPHPHTMRQRETHIFHIGKYGPPQGGSSSFGTSAPSPGHTYTGAISGKYSLVSKTFAFRPEEAMFDWHSESLSLI